MSLRGHPRRGITSMGYDSLCGGGSGWQAYQWQQNTFLAPGYKSYEFNWRPWD